MNPNRHSETLRNAERALRAGQYAQLEALCGQVLKRDKRNVVATELLARAAFQRGDLETAAAHYDRCRRLRPKATGYTHRLGQVLAEQGRTADAIKCFDAALGSDPDNVAYVASKIVALERDGTDDAAREMLRPHIAAGAETPAMVGAHARLEIRAGRLDEAIDYLRGKLDADAGTPGDRRTWLFTLARAYEKAGDFDRSFASAAEANAIERPPFDAAAYVASIDALIDTFSTGGLARCVRATDETESPVFVAGMPRSGTTLVEQIIDAHPDGYGAGERIDLPQMVDGLQMTLDSFHSYPRCVLDMSVEQCDRLAGGYLDTLRRLAPRAKRIVNKSLDNVLHLGLVSRLFPGSRAIVCRRDPMDTCLSCFMNPILPSRFRFITDLRALGLAYRQHERLLAHWRAVLEIPMIDVVYESMIDDHATQARGLIESLGLPWNDACLRFYESGRTVMTLSYDQVSRPIYRSSVGRWKNFEKHMTPLREALEEHALPSG